MQGGKKALEKAHKREKTREIACTLQSKMVCSEVCMACRRCAAHVGMAPLFLGVLLPPPTFQGVRADWLKEADVVVIPTRTTSRDIEPLMRMRKAVFKNGRAKIVYVMNGWNRFKAAKATFALVGTVREAAGFPKE